MRYFSTIEYLLDTMIETILCYKTHCKIIDQTLLPEEFKQIEITTAEAMFEAIQTLRVRGAPAIGIAGAMGVYLGLKDSESQNSEEFLAQLEKVGSYLASSRPTAVNLFWAIDRVKKVAEEKRNLDVTALKQILFEEVQNIWKEDDAMCRKIGEFGAKLLKDGSTILTHCNAGGLATSGYGTALAPVYVAAEQGKKVRVFADETRPLLQGARLTAWELAKNQIDVTLICDNTAASVMAKGWIDLVIVGADRIAVNGDFANKVGTYGVAILAKEHGIPFYVAAPYSTIDLNMKNGKSIVIEERNEEEVTQGFGKRTAPRGIKVYNPAFDVTPTKYVSGFITEKGIVKPPFLKNDSCSLDRALIGYKEEPTL